MLPHLWCAALRAKRETSCAPDRHVCRYEEHGRPVVICEVQVALAGIYVLKAAEHAVYAVERMESAEELRDTFIYSSPKSAPS